jgi:hypothetical protein
MTTPAIRTVGLTKTYGPVIALDGLDLEIAPGEVVGYLGPNGAGNPVTELRRSLPAPGLSSFCRPLAPGRRRSARPELRLARDRPGPIPTAPRPVRLPGPSRACAG